MAERDLWQSKHQVLAALARTEAVRRGDLERTLRELTLALITTQQVQRASIWLYDQERAALRCLELHEVNGQERPCGGVLRSEDFPSYFLALEEARTIAADDAHRDPRTSELSQVYLRPLGINSMLDAPIRHRGKVVGVVCQEHVGQGRAWTAAEQSFAGSVADFVSLALEAEERLKAEQALAQRVEELARLAATLEQFAYVARHDLQEPLRIVSSYVALLERKFKGRLDSEADSYIRYALEGTARMHRLVEDLLTYSRPRPEQWSRELDADRLVKEVLCNLQQAVEETAAQILVHPLPRLRGEGAALAQVFHHLIENALKFRGQDLPRIEIRAEPEGTGWHFSVSDNGIGIAMEHAERIFGAFERLHEHGRYGGAGLGLAIARRIIAAQGGKIWLQSQPGEGSTFHFHLPQQP